MLEAELSDSKKPYEKTVQMCTALSSLLSCVFIKYLVYLTFRLNSAVIKAKREAILTVFNHILTEYNEAAGLIRNSLVCLSNILAMNNMESAAWKNSLVEETFIRFLAFSIDGRPKVRKAALEGLTYMRLDERCDEKALKIISSFIKNGFDSAKTEDAQMIFRMIPLLKSLSGIFDQDMILGFIEKLLAFVDFENAHLSCTIFEYIEFVSVKERENISKDSLLLLLTTLVQLKPSKNENILLLPWLSCLACSLVGLAGQVEQAKEFESYGISWEIAKIVESSFEWNLGNNPDNLLKIVKSLIVGVKEWAFPLLKSLMLLLGKMYETAEGSTKLLLEEIFSDAAKSMGIKSFLKCLPLNLVASKESDVNRAWLLTILKDAVENGDFSFFVTEFVPLSSAMIEKQNSFAASSKAIEAKVYETVNYQIWALFPGFCKNPSNFASSFASIAELLLELMVNSADIRHFICTGLSRLIEDFSSASSGSSMVENNISSEEATNGLRAIGSISKKYLSSLCGLFCELPADQRSFVGELIKSLVKATSESDINSLFKNIMKRLIDLSTAGSDIPAELAERSSLTTIITLMSRKLDKKHANIFIKFNFKLLQSNDTSIQKKAYKGILGVFEENHLKEELLNENLNEIENEVFSETTMLASTASKKERLKLLKVFSALSAKWIQLTLPEAIIGLKEVNEKTRNIAYELLISLGNSMKNDLSEFIKMIIAGLASSSPFMISATVMALSRVIYEFKDDLPESVLNELIISIQLLSENTNREIAKSAIGFTKLVTTILPTEMIRPLLSEIVLNLFKWSHVHRNHFKMNIRHIFERLIRRFGYELIESLSPMEDRKMIVNIKRRKERSKKKRHGKPLSFEDAIEGSEDEGSDSEREEDFLARKLESNVSIRKNKTFIRESNDDPIDLLDESTLSRRLLSKKPVEKKSKTSPSSFPVNEDGKLVFKEDEQDENVDSITEGKEYMELLNSKDSFTRPGKHIKFSSNKRNRNEMEDDDEVEEEKAKPAKVMLSGKEYKSKKAGGDVKKKSAKFEPYAYIPLDPKGLPKSKKAKELLFRKK